jgi:hypothetical protein
MGKRLEKKSVQSPGNEKYLGSSSQEGMGQESVSFKVVCTYFADYPCRMR